MKETYRARIEELKQQRDRLQADMAALIDKLVASRDEEARTEIIRDRARMAAEVDALTEEMETIYKIDQAERGEEVDVQLAALVDQLKAMLQDRLQASTVLQGLRQARLRAYNAREVGSAMKAAELSGQIAVQQVQVAQLERAYQALVLEMDRLDQQRLEILGQPAMGKKGTARQVVDQVTRETQAERRRLFEETKAKKQRVIAERHEKERAAAAEAQTNQAQSDEVERAERRRAYAESLYS